MTLKLPSSITKLVLDGRDFYIKRDDLVDPFLSGNKFRKLYSLLKTPKQNLKRIISYGGTQSNAMLSIAYMCHQKGWEFLYYTKTLSKTQLLQDAGNYTKSIEFDMKHIELGSDEYRDKITNIRFNLDPMTFVVDQGGANIEADAGLELLANEIKQSGFKQIATPSGTGTTALFLAKNLPNCTIFTTPCIGDSEYLIKQMSALCALPKNLVILEPTKKYHFAKPYVEFLEIYHKLFESGVEFDLLYAPNMWLVLQEQTNGDVLYVHSGGVYGNSSMLSRYAKKSISI